MKLNSNKSSKKGIAMTEYLIMVGIVAIGCVMAAGYFGQTVKTVFKGEATALSGSAPEKATVNEDATRSGFDNYGKNVVGN